MTPCNSFFLYTMSYNTGFSSFEQQMAFVEEFNIMKKACSGECPNIVYILGYIKEVTSTDLAIVLEYVPLGDLQSMLRKWKELVRLAFTYFV